MQQDTKATLSTDSTQHAVTRCLKLIGSRSRAKILPSPSSGEHSNINVIPGRVRCRLGGEKNKNVAPDRILIISASGIATLPGHEM